MTVGGRVTVSGRARARSRDRDRFGARPSSRVRGRVVAVARQAGWG